MNAHTHAMMAITYPPHWTDGPAPRCSFCGSLTPAALSQLIGRGYKLHWTVYRHGRPEACEVEGLPTIQSCWFYIEHLQDATSEEQEQIEQAMHYRFKFDSIGNISWQPIRTEDADAPRAYL